MDEPLIVEMYLYLFVIAGIVGAVANKTNFCTMGAVSDWVNMEDKTRFYSWLLAIAVSILGAMFLQEMQLVDLSETRPPYRSSNFALGQYVFGGLLFGVGMTLASGCGNKTMIRIGGGNLKSIVVLIVMGTTAYLMTTTKTGHAMTFGLLSPLSIDLASHGIESQEISHFISAITGIDCGADAYRSLTSVLIVGVLLTIMFRDSHFRKSGELIFGGTVIGLAVTSFWLITGGPMGKELAEFVDFMDNPPQGMGVQALTFASPTADLARLVVTGFDSSMLTIGLMTLFGVIVGSFVYSITTGNFRVEWFASKSDVANHLIGGVLMGVGAMLGMGCTFGQGISGVSTLAVGSAIVMLSILLGSALTMKIQYYQMVYEEEATFVAAFLSSLADLKLIPNKYRMLEAV